MSPKKVSNQPELLVHLVPGEGSMHNQVERGLREAVRSGRLAPGTAIPSTRTLARDLQVSRGVIVEAYQQLSAEGFLAIRPGGRTVVAWQRGSAAPGLAPRRASRPRYDFRPGHADLRHFPREEWSRAARRVHRALHPRQLGYVEPSGAPELRTALADYLGRVRGVSASPSQVIVCSGFTQGLGMVARALVREGVRRVVVEDPGHRLVQRTLELAGMELIFAPVDERGIRTDVIEQSGAQAVLVTPAHQFPTGCVLHPGRRRELLAWAERRSAVIIEDDYDAEHRYDRSPVGALQGLLPERVIYAGSASKVLAPALRLGWLVMPPSMLASAAEEKELADLGSSFLEQLVFAEFLQSGVLDRHLRRMRVLYRERRDALLTALARHCPAWMPHGAAAGLHLLARLPDSSDEIEVVRAAAERSVRLYPLSMYRVTADATLSPAVVIGYACLTAHQIGEGIKRLRGD